MRTRLRIAYRGTHYHGWQQQPTARTVEGEVRQALCRILNVPAETLVFQGASRTDAGVHALAQTAHFDHDGVRSDWTLVRGVNSLTADDITILRAEEVDPGFDARRCAGGKIYQYRIWNHRFPHPLLVHDAWHMRHPLDLDRMQDAARRLIGAHDFRAFRAVDCQAKTTARDMRRVELEQDGAELRLIIEGDAFLKYMVRIITGTLVAIGAGRAEPEVIDAMFVTGDRGLGGTTAPAHGLTLMHVFYPDHPWRLGEPTLGGPCCEPAPPGQ